MIDASILVNYVCKRFQLNADEIFSCTRKREVADARAVIAAVLIHYGYTQRRTAEYLQCTRSGVTAMNRRAHQVAEIRHHYEHIKELINKGKGQWKSQ